MSDQDDDHLDAEIVDHDRAAELVAMADRRISDLDLQRSLETEEVERALYWQ